MTRWGLFGSAFQTRYQRSLHLKFGPPPALSFPGGKAAHGENERTNLHQLPSRRKSMVSQKSVRSVDGPFRSGADFHGH